MDFEAVLDDCLARMGAGESVASCLERYPADAPELRPLLQAAEQLHMLAAARLTQGQRLRAKVALRETLAGQRRPVRPPFWSRLRALPLAAAFAVFLFVGVAISAVASSQPGDLAYSVRVVVERAPVWVQLSNEGRATAELATAERRLNDVSESAHQDGAVPDAALTALLRGVNAAARRAERLPADERAALAERVSNHALALMRLAEEAVDPDLATRLRSAAQQVAGAAGKLKLPAPAAEQGTQEPAPTAAAVIVTVAPTAAQQATTVPLHPLPTAVLPTAAATQRPATLPTTAFTPTATTVSPVASETPAPPVVVSTPQSTETAVVALPTSPLPRHTRTPRPRPTFAIPTVVVPVPETSTPVLPPRQTRTPEPTGTASTAGDPPTPTATPAPTHTPTAGSTVRPTSTQRPTAVVMPSPTATWYLPLPTATLTPTSTATSYFVPLPTATPTVSGPQATRTAQAQLTATATVTGAVTMTPTPRGPRATALAMTVTPTLTVTPTGTAPTAAPQVTETPGWMPTRPPRPR